MSRHERRAMIDRGHHELSVVRQCELLDISRSSAYYSPVQADEYELELMGLVDKQYLLTPFYGSRKMAVWLRGQGHQVNRKRVQRLMRRMGIEAIYRRPRTTMPDSGHKVYPYLLRGLEIDRVNQVWAADITYIPMVHGFMYLVCVMDWHSRYVLSWRLSNTLEADSCVDALEEALSRDLPGVFNTDQGSQFTSETFTSVLVAHGVRISMDSVGSYMDNVFVERLWRSVKYEDVYLKAYESVAEARAGIGAYLRFYNSERPHQTALLPYWGQFLDHHFVERLPLHHHVYHGAVPSEHLHPYEMGHIHGEAINGSEDGIIFLPPSKGGATGFSGLELIPGLLTVSFVLVIPAVVALILSLCHKRPHAFSPPPLIPPPRLIS